MTEGELQKAREVSSRVPSLDGAARTRAMEWLLSLTGLPTAAGREEGPIGWVRSWVAERADLSMREDRAGNLVIEFAHAPSAEAVRPLFITGHLDHPAFVVEEVLGDGLVRLSFRGGVLDAYFVDAPIVVCVPRGDGRGWDEVAARVLEAGAAEPLRRCVARIEGGQDAGLVGRIGAGMIGRWRMEGPSIVDGVLRTHACDDLAAVVAALAVMEHLRERSDAAGRHTRLLLTRAEEVGFVGAYAACRDGTMPRNARTILLENSRAFAESPMHGGVIVRVGDRLTTFSPDFTAGISRTAELLDAGRQSAGVTDARSFRPVAGAGLKWQRKLMSGGACESTCYQAFGYESACLCLPLGNYHNMADLSAVQAGESSAVSGARCGPEMIGVDDFVSMVELLIGCAVAMGQAEPMVDRLERIYREVSFVLGDRA